MDLDREKYQPFVKINFNAKVNVNQELTIIDEDITPEQLIRGLNKGEYLTTMSYESGPGKIATVVRFDEQDNEIEIATILSQEIYDDISSLTDFVLLESSDD